MADVTQLLEAIQQGQPQAAEQLLPLVYDELRKLARLKLRQEKPSQTLQATALVHVVSASTPGFVLKHFLLTRIYKVPHEYTSMSAVVLFRCRHRGASIAAVGRWPRAGFPVQRKRSCAYMELDCSSGRRRRSQRNIRRSPAGRADAHRSRPSNRAYR